MSQTSQKLSARASSSDTLPTEPVASWIELVQQKVQSLEFGFVQIVVHDSNVVQVESTERHRFDLRRSK